MNTVQIELGTPPQLQNMLFDINNPAPIVFPVKLLPVQQLNVQLLRLPLLGQPVLCHVSQHHSPELHHRQQLHSQCLCHRHGLLSAPLHRHPLHRRSAIAVKLLQLCHPSDLRHIRIGMVAVP